MENSNQKLKSGNLVIYHNAPAVITDILKDKITILLPNNKSRKVREKDILFLHQEAVKNLSDLETELEGDIESALELLEGETVDINDLSELIFGENSCKAVYKTWRILEKGIYFSGNINEITPNSKEYIENILTKQREKEQEIKNWNDNISRVKERSVTEEDLIKLKDVEQVAFGKNTSNKTMKALNIEANEKKAHKLLLDLNVWNDTVNPYPKRFNCSLNSPETDIIEVPQETRKDLTHLKTYAIDSENTKDPDDAISLDGKYLWIHIADVASVITRDSELDSEARARGTSLYLPEKVVNMIPQKVVETLGLGLNEISPALSFKILVDDEGKPICEEITPSIVKVNRISYKKADDLINEEPFFTMASIINRFYERRKRNGSKDIILHEADVHIKTNEELLQNSMLKINSNENFTMPEINIHKIENSESREMVSNSMLLTGEAVAGWLGENNIAAPFVCQNEPEELKDPETMSEMLGYLKTFQKSKLCLSAGKHFGLGLDKYVRVTSPLRRYSDLLVHQQIRAFLANKELIDAKEMEEKMTESEFTSLNCTMAGRLSTKHWKLFYIKHLSNKEFKGILLDKRNGKGIVSLADIAVDVKIHNVKSIDLDSELTIKITDINIPKLELYGKIVE